MWNSIRASADAVLHLCLPVACAGCGAPGLAVCASCANELRPRSFQRTLADGLNVHSALEFNDTIAAVIRAVKRDNRAGVLRHLAPAFAAAVDAATRGQRRVAVVPMPQRPQSQRARGFWVVGELCRLADIPMTEALRLVRTPQDQRELRRDERERNMAGVFACRTDRLRSSNAVLLVDDVITTGATLRAANLAVRHAGIPVIQAATAVTTLARVP